MEMDSQRKGPFAAEAAFRTNSIRDARLPALRPKGLGANPQINQDEYTPQHQTS